MKIEDDFNMSPAIPAVHATENSIQNLPLPTIRRFPIYLRKIQDCVAREEEYISGALLADVLNLDHVVVRKDLAMTGVSGTPRLGFPTKELAAAITRALGWDIPTQAALIGVGHLGGALLGHRGFREHNLKIALAFDANPALAGTRLHGTTILPVEEMESTIQRLHIVLAILTVPSCAAQSCADKLVAAGIRGIWNFTGVSLNVPDNIKVQQEDLASGLAVLSHMIASTPQETV